MLSALTMLLSFFLFTSFSVASPITSPERCLWPFCKRGEPYTVNTVIGTAQGTLDTDGVVRYAAKYASAARWEASTVLTSWELPNGGTNASAMPLPCPQPGLSDGQYSEDCLSIVLYVPSTLNSYSNAATLLWIHGGSYIVGSASDPAIEGARLAYATQSIVAVVQYRLGAFGWMSPTGATNNAVKDVISAMEWLHKVAPSFGGQAGKLTVAGQSSGAHTVRALLATPSASSLFQNAIMQSDPKDFGFLTTSVQTLLHNSFMSSLGCGTTNSTCLSAQSTDAVLNLSMDLFENAYTLDPSIGQFEPMRPVVDGSLITSPLDSTAPFPKVSKHIIVSTVMTEAGSVIYGNYPAIPESQFESYVNGTFGSPRTGIIVNSSYYLPTPGTTDARVQLQTLGTDYIWKCSAWTFAREWVANGGTAYVGIYALGSTYPSNQGIPFCTQPGSVCHQDDIQIVFGTAPSPTPPQTLLISQMQARYKAFMNGGNPNPGLITVPSWSAATSSNVNAVLFGSPGPGSPQPTVGGCVPTFWGVSPQYDYQVYNA